MSRDKLALRWFLPLITGVTIVGNCAHLWVFFFLLLSLYILIDAPSSQSSLTQSLPHFPFSSEGERLLCITPPWHIKTSGRVSGGRGHKAAQLGERDPQTDNRFRNGLYSSCWGTSKLHICSPAHVRSLIGLPFRGFPKHPQLLAGLQGSRLVDSGLPMEFLFLSGPSVFSNFSPMVGCGSLHVFQSAAG